MSKTNWAAIMKSNPDIKLGREILLTYISFSAGKFMFACRKPNC